MAQREFKQIFPESGWVEHDPEEIAASQIAVALEALANANTQPRDVAAIGITNQRETTIVWDRATGKPIYNAIVWQDRRTAAFCNQLKARGHEDLIQQRTGLLIDAYFSASKISWILEHVPNARPLAESGRLAFGTVDTWLVWKLTGGRVHVTDASNASRTMLFNLHSGRWDNDLLDLFRIPASMLPAVRPSSEVYGEVSSVPGLNGIPIAGIAGDQQAALFGQRCTSRGLTKNTYGTGCFMLQSTGNRAVASTNRLLTTVAWRIGDTTDYALEGSVFVGGAVVQWLRDGLGIIRSSSEVEALGKFRLRQRRSVFRPGFRGPGRSALGFLRARRNPRPHARQQAGHIARAALESIAYQVADLMDAVQTDTNTPLKELRVDGGASANDALMQFQADVSRRMCRAPRHDGDDRARRSIPSRSGRRFLEGSADSL